MLLLYRANVLCACSPRVTEPCTSFCVTVSIIVPKAGIVDILTELKTEKPSLHNQHSNTHLPFKWPNIKTQQNHDIPITWMINVVSKMINVTWSFPVRKPKLNRQQICKPPAKNIIKKNNHNIQPRECGEETGYLAFKNVSELRLTHNSGPLHKVIRAGATRLSIKASLMPRRTSCKPVRCKREGGSNTNGQKPSEGVGTVVLGAAWEGVGGSDLQPNMPWITCMDESIDERIVGNGSFFKRAMVSVACCLNERC